MSVGWERKTEFVPALMVRDPAVERMKGLAFDPILPAALRVRLLAVMVGKTILFSASVVGLAMMAPSRAVMVRLVPGSIMGEAMVMSPVAWVRVREESEPTSGR